MANHTLAVLPEDMIEHIWMTTKKKAILDHESALSDDKNNAAPAVPKDVQ